MVEPEAFSQALAASADAADEAPLAALRDRAPCLDGPVDPRAWSAFLRSRVLDDLSAGRAADDAVRRWVWHEPVWAALHPVDDLPHVDPPSGDVWYPLPDAGFRHRWFVDGHPDPPSVLKAGPHLVQLQAPGGWNSWWVDGALPIRWGPERRSGLGPVGVTGVILGGVGVAGSILPQAIRDAWAGDDDHLDEAVIGMSAAAGFSALMIGVDTALRKARARAFRPHVPAGATEVTP